MTDDNARPRALLVAAPILLVAALVTWAALGFALPAAITGSQEATRTVPAAAVSQGSTATAAAGAPAKPAPTTTVGAPASDLAPRATTHSFDGARAFALLREQVRKYGWRPAGSRALRRLAVRLRALLPHGRFEAIPGHKGLRNVVGSLPGYGKPIVVGAHYDVIDKPAGFVGANDGAAGTAAVVELARALARAPRSGTRRAVRFVLFDGEEASSGCSDFLACGVRGSRAYVKRHRAEIQSLVLLDYIAEKHGMSFPHEGGSDPTLWAKLRAAADDVGVGSLFTDVEGIEILDDHTPFMDAGIPAIDVIDFDYPQTHTLRDDLDHVSQRSLDAIGETAYRLITRLRRDG
jgi:hypothetical protein